MTYLSHRVAQMLQSHDPFAFGLVVTKDVILRLFIRRGGAIGRQGWVWEFASQPSVHLLLQVVLRDLPRVPVRRDGHLRHQALSHRVRVWARLPAVLFRHVCLIITNLCGWKVSFASYSSSPRSVANRRHTGERRLSQRPPPLFRHRVRFWVGLIPPVRGATGWYVECLSGMYRNEKSSVEWIYLTLYNKWCPCR